MDTVRVDPGHDENIHLFKQTCSPRSITIHFTQQSHGALVSGRLIAMNSSLKPNAKLRRVLRLRAWVAQEDLEKRTSLLGLEVGNLVIEPIVATCDVAEEVVWAVSARAVTTLDRPTHPVRSHWLDPKCR